MDQCACTEPFPTSEGPGAICRKCRLPLAPDAEKSELAQASDPGTPPDLLEELSFSDDPAVVAAVLANPSTPTSAAQAAGMRVLIKQTSTATAAPSPTVRRGVSVGQPSANEGTRLLEAQLATVDYIRSGLLLLIAVIISSTFFTLGNQAQVQRALACGGSSSCSESGGTLYFVFGGLLASAAMVASVVYWFMGDSHRKVATK